GHAGAPAGLGADHPGALSFLPPPAHVLPGRVGANLLLPCPEAPRRQCRPGAAGKPAPGLQRPGRRHPAEAAAPHRPGDPARPGDGPAPADQRVHRFPAPAPPGGSRPGGPGAPGREVHLLPLPGRCSGRPGSGGGPVPVRRRRLAGARYGWWPGRRRPGRPGRHQGGRRPCCGSDGPVTSALRSQRVRAVLVSLALGGLGASLDLFGGPPGLNVLLAAGALVLGLRLVLGPLSRMGRLLLAAGIVPAAGLILWDALQLRALNLLALLGCLGLFLRFGVEPGREAQYDEGGESGEREESGEGDPQGDRPWTLGGASVVQGLAGLAVAAGYGLVGGPILWTATAREMNGKQTARRWLPVAGAATRGLLMAVPLLLFFMMLFTAADPAFGRLLDSLAAWDGWLAPAGHWLIRFAFWAWMAAGVLYTALRNP